MTVPTCRNVRKMVLALTVGLGLLLAAEELFGPRPVAAQQSADAAVRQGRKITLRNQMVVGLRARSASDRAFLDKVVVAVETGRLPRQLVDSTFLWARQRAARKSPSRRLRPLVYFQPALLQRAKRLGITI